jgi:intein-encoded DNA endonuclease-like protein
MIDDNGFKVILKSLPPKPDRSKLEPYAKLILELHRQGRSYREIAQVLSERCNLKTSRSTVNDFVRARLIKPQKLQKKQKIAELAQSNQSGLMPRMKPEIKLHVTEEEIQRRISDIKKQQTKTENPSQLFEYDPDQPLQLPSKK